jgi:hypothetical protein
MGRKDRHTFRNFSFKTRIQTLNYLKSVWNKTQISIWTHTTICNTKQTWSPCKPHNFTNLHTKCGLLFIPAILVHSSWTRHRFQQTLATKFLPRGRFCFSESRSINYLFSTFHLLSYFCSRKGTNNRLMRSSRLAFVVPITTLHTLEQCSWKLVEVLHH